MKFGLFYELQLPTPWEEGGTNRLFRETLEHVQLAEQLGFIVTDSADSCAYSVQTAKPVGVVF